MYRRVWDPANPRWPTGGGGGADFLFVLGFLAAPRAGPAWCIHNPHGERMQHAVHVQAHRSYVLPIRLLGRPLRGSGRVPRGVPTAHSLLPRSWCTYSVENRCLPRPRARVPGPSAHASCKSAPACSAWSLSGPKRVVLAAHRRCRHSSGAWMSRSWDVLTHTASSCAPDVAQTLGPLLFQARGQRGGQRVHQWTQSTPEYTIHPGCRAEQSPAQ
jgi:hypothetical protein